MNTNQPRSTFHNYLRTVDSIWCALNDELVMDMSQLDVIREMWARGFSARKCATVI